MISKLMILTVYCLLSDEEATLLLHKDESTNLSLSFKGLPYIFKNQRQPNEYL